MERADLMQQGIGPAEAREDDEAQHQAADVANFAMMIADTVTRPCERSERKANGR